MSKLKNIQKDMEKTFLKGKAQLDKKHEELNVYHRQIKEHESNMDFDKAAQLEADSQPLKTALLKYEEKYQSQREMHSKDFYNRLYGAFLDEWDEEKEKAGKRLDQAAEHIAKAVEIIDDLQQDSSKKNAEIGGPIKEAGTLLTPEFSRMLNQQINILQFGQVAHLDTLKYVYRDNWGLLPNDPGNNQSA